MQAHSSTLVTRLATNPSHRTVSIYRCPVSPCKQATFAGQSQDTAIEKWPKSAPKRFRKVLILKKIISPRVGVPLQTGKRRWPPKRSGFPRYPPWGC